METRTGNTISWFCVSSNINIELVRGALNKAPRVAAAPTMVEDIKNQHRNKRTDRL